MIAESVFKYAGSVYKDIDKLQTIVEANGDTTKVFATYGKHWGELKGFALALQCGKNNLGETAVKMNRMMGFGPALNCGRSNLGATGVSLDRLMGLGPVLLDTSQVVSVDANGNFVMGSSSGMDAYKNSMLEIQKLMVDVFAVKARANDQLANM